MNKHVKRVLVIGLAGVIFLSAAGIVVVERGGNGLKASSQRASTQTGAVPAPDNQPSPAFLPGAKFAPEGLKVKDNSFVFDSRRIDVNGDGIADEVVLFGEKQGNGNPFVQNIGVAVKDGHTGKFAMASVGEYDVGLNPKLFIGRFTSAKTNDILVSLATGGSGGVYQYSLMADEEGQVTPIVPQKELNGGLTLETQCLSGFMLEVTDKNTGYTATIDLHKGAADYERLGIYDAKGNLLKDPMVLIDGFGVLRPEGDNGDGIYELQGIQRISVGYHANSVANVESVWTVSGGQLKLVSEKVEALN